MSLQSHDVFIQWLDEQEVRRGWTDYRLAKEAKLAPSVLSRARSGILPKWEACEAIAHALGVSPVVVFRKAGLLPPGPENETQFEDWQYLLSQLPADEQEEMRQVALLKIEKRKKAEAASLAASRKLRATEG